MDTFKFTEFRITVEATQTAMKHIAYTLASHKGPFIKGYIVSFAGNHHKAPKFMSANRYVALM